MLLGLVTGIIQSPRESDVAPDLRSKAHPAGPSRRGPQASVVVVAASLDDGHRGAPGMERDRGQCSALILRRGGAASTPGSSIVRR